MSANTLTLEPGLVGAIRANAKPPRASRNVPDLTALPNAQIVLDDENPGDVQIAWAIQSLSSDLPSHLNAAIGNFLIEARLRGRSN